MDQDATLEEMRALVARVGDKREERDDHERLVELVQAMDEWLSKGSALPEAWKRD